MTNSNSASREYIAFHILNLFPGLVRSELLADSKLLRELGVVKDATLSFGEKDIAFSRNTLFQAIRSAYENVEKEFSVEDVNSNFWSLRNIPGDPPAFSLFKGDKSILINSFWPLNCDVNRRLKIFEAEARIRGLTKDEFEHWRAVLSAPTLSDDEVSDLFLDLDCSPSNIEALLRQEFQGQSNRISTLVPDDIRYYERLVGKYNGSKNIYEYCNVELKQYFGSRIENEISENDFLICIHSSISEVVSSNVVDEDSYHSIANKAIETCHPILLISCIELGIQKFTDSSATIIKALFDCMSSVKTLENLRLFCSMGFYPDSTDGFKTLANITSR